MTVFDGQQYLDATEVRGILGIGLRALRNRIRSGALPEPRLVGGRRYWPEHVVLGIASQAKAEGGTK